MRLMEIQQRRKAVAEVTHQVVSEVSGTDGVGHCMLYAVIGAAAAQVAFGGQWFPQAGALNLRPDPNDPNFVISFDSKHHGIDSGEMHCWFVGTWQDGKQEMVDLSARHYPRMISDFILVKTTEQKGVVLVAEVDTETTLAARQWKRSSCPDYLWAEIPQSQLWPYDWVLLKAEQAACKALTDKIIEHRESYMQMYRRAIQLLSNRNLLRKR
jgi:hypothetical protein